VPEAPAIAVFLDTGTVDRGDIDWSPLHQPALVWRLHRQTPPERIAERIRDARVVVTNKVRLDRAAIAAAPALELIQVAATGTDNVDLEAARKRGVAVRNVAGYATASVVQHVFALILALTNRLTEHVDAVARGRWTASDTFCLLDFPFHELAGRRLGVVGYGTLGRAVARAAACFGMEVLVAERRGAVPRPGRRAFEEVLEQAHVLSLHCPLTPETRHLIGAAELARMRRDALLVNTARGAVIDTAALAEALRRERIAGAGIDVLDTEPPPERHPLLRLRHPRLVVTPHVAWASRESRQRLVDGIGRSIAAFQDALVQ
jgi:glycerate dehydrogenase